MFRVSLFDFFVRNVIIISKAPAARKTARCRAIAEKTGLFYTIHLDENMSVDPNFSSEQIDWTPLDSSEKDTAPG